MQFSSRFKQLCKERHITQQQALADMGFHRNAAQRWIDGSPSTDAVVKIAAYFGISTDCLLGTEANAGIRSSEQSESGGMDTKKAPALKMGKREYTDDEILNAIARADEKTKAAILLLLEVK